MCCHFLQYLKFSVDVVIFFFLDKKIIFISAAFSWWLYLITKQSVGIFKMKDFKGQ